MWGRRFSFENNREVMIMHRESRTESRKRKFRNVFVRALGEGVLSYAEKCGRFETDIAAPAREERKPRAASVCDGGVCQVEGDFHLYLKAMKNNAKDAE